jgi:lipid-A-disaccharide synthase-like uncharacterized protein
MLETLQYFFRVETMSELLWVLIGLSGQLMFSARFFVQWLASEKEHKSVIPITFWYFSIAGGLILLAYALYRQDPVFVLGQAFGLFVYGRNLYLLHQEQRDAT